MLALDGILVADLSRVLAGPYATMSLADLGATVVKVERPGSGDDTRAWGPPWTSAGSTYFESVNRSKRSLAADLDDPADRALVAELCRRADVVVENFRPGALARHGLAYDAVAATNPAVVYCSISGFGTAGGADLPGYDFVVQAVGGLMSITGDAEGRPTKVGVALVDVLTGKDALAGILAALLARARTGAGAHVQVDLLSSLLAALVNQASAALATGESPGRLGNRHPSIAPYETLRCADGLLAVAAGNDRQFRSLARAVGDEGLADDPAYATNPARVAHRDGLAGALERDLAADTVSGWTRRLAAVGIACGPVNDVRAAFALATELGLHPTAEVGPDRVAQVRSPLGLPTAAPTAPPRLGEHTAELRRWLSDGD